MREFIHFRRLTLAVSTRKCQVGCRKRLRQIPPGETKGQWRLDSRARLYVQMYTINVQFVGCVKRSADAPLRLKRSGGASALRLTHPTSRGEIDSPSPA